MMETNIKSFKELLEEKDFALSVDEVLKVFQNYYSQMDAIKPLRNLILVAPFIPNEQVVAGDFVLPENMKDKKKFGILVAKGQSADENIKVGNKLFWLGEEGVRFIIDNNEFILMEDNRLKAVL